MQPPPIPPTAQHFPQPSQFPPPSRPSSSVSKVVLIVIACVVGVVLLLSVLIALLLPSLSRAREMANRIKCANNLRSIGQSFALYVGSDVGVGHLPRTVYRPGPNPAVTWGTGKQVADPNADPFSANSQVQDNDVTALLFLSMRNTDATTPDTFICPSSDCDRWDFKTAHVDSFVNWSSTPGTPNDYHTHLSYSVQNPYASKAAVERGFGWSGRLIQDRSDLPIAADINPGPGPKTRINSSAVPPQQSLRTSPARAIRGANSPNHGGDGQNVLYGDGHVNWETTPWCGPNGDNIYTARTTPAGMETTSNQNLSSTPGSTGQSPFDADDVILLPCKE